MKERIEAKIDEIIERILAKDAKDITQDEYGILEAKLTKIRFNEACGNDYAMTFCSCATSEEIEKLKEEENKK